MTQVFVIALVSSLDAGLLAATVVLLGRPRPARQLLAYLIGGMGLSIAFGVAIVLVLHGSNLLREPSRSTSAVIEVVAGALLIVVALAVRWGRAVHWHPRRAGQDDADQPQRQSLYDRAVGHDSVWIAWAAGAVYSVPGAYYLAGLALLAKSSESAATDVLAILGFNLIMFALIELPLIGFLLAPDRTRSLTAKLNGWMTAHRRTLIVIVAGAGGAYLLISGLSDLG
ncbi:MAG TPA: GAP family protein [Gaiellales bacterium]|nr:GAP family protein [Gaiellales bacterium]